MLLDAGQDVNETNITEDNDNNNNGSSAEDINTPAAYRADRFKNVSPTVHPANLMAQHSLDSDLEMARLLISRGVDLNPKMMEISPLHIAVGENKPRLVKLLVEHGANLEVIERQY